MDNQELEIAKQTVIEDEKPKATLVDKLKEQRKRRQKIMTRRMMKLAGLLLFVYVVWFLFKPFKASEEYGICYTMLELNVPYPHTLYVSEVVNKRDGSMVLWYTHIDAFGGYRMEPFSCKFARNPETQMLELTEVKLNKVTLDPDHLANLNNAMIYFKENPLIMNYPIALPDSLSDLQIETEMFRKFKLDIRQ